MYSLLTRSQRISHENLRLRDKAWLEGYERWFAAAPACLPASNDRAAAADVHAVPRFAGSTLSNRIVVLADGDVFGATTACRTISISCISARARSAARASSSAR